jgi:intein/homing endonuclease
MNINEHNRIVALNRWRNILKESSKRFMVNSLKYPFLKARIIGYLIGDGSVSVHYGSDGNAHHSIDFYPDDLGMLKSYIQAMSLVYDVIPKIKNLGNYYSVRTSSKPIVLDLLKITSFKSLDWKVPMLSKSEEKIEFLRAIYDCEGYVGEKLIAIQSVNKVGLVQVSDLLKEFRILSKLYSYKRKNPRWNTNYLLYITDKESRRNFLKRIGFSHSKKLLKLKLYAGVA